MTLELTPEQTEALEALVTDLGAASKAEAIRRALAMAGAIVDTHKRGLQIAAVTDDLHEVVHLIVFP